ncbi:MAG TPA: hypothetical protein DCQ43_07290 [Treponema sp.]|nr:hypothetical protein [Treponema sp.]
MKKANENIEIVFLFLLLLFMLPFPIIVENIIIIGIIVICLFFSLSYRLINNKIKQIFADNLPYLVFTIMLLQIHTVRFSLIANKINDQIISVQIMQWITEELKSSEIIVFGTLIYLWLLLYFLIVFSDIEVNKIVVVNEHFKYETFNLQKIKIIQGKEKQDGEISINTLLKKNKYEEEFCFNLSKIRKYLIAGFVINVVQILCGVSKDILFKQKSFESCFFNNAVITIGSCIPFIIIYILMIRFVFVYYRCNEND